MLIFAFAALFTFVLLWSAFYLIFYTALYGSLIIAYICIWDNERRKEMCPHGLLSAILLNK